MSSLLGIGTIILISIFIILCIIAGLTVLIVVLAKNSNKSVQMVCPRCNALCSKDSVFCTNCGMRFYGRQ